jgi:hypothetical protein
MPGIKRSALLTTGQQMEAAAASLEKEIAVGLNGESATFKCSKFLDLVEAAAWAVAARPAVSAHGYRTVAGEFLAVVELLADEPAVALSPWVYMAAQTLECSLKAYITKLGLTAPTRRQGHDLINLWRTAVKASTTTTKKISIDPTPPEWCAMLNVFHDYPYLDRYPGEHGLALKTERAQLARELRTILTEVEAAFQ